MDTNEEEEEEEEDQYFYPNSDDVENVEYYRPGGFHPVHLGDMFDDGRFRILHKLGNGGFATVWLALDNVLHSYVALKIHQAEKLVSSKELEILNFLKDETSNHIGKCRFTQLLHNFIIQGPNGSHLCLVTTVAGPSARDLSDWKRRLPPKEARKMALELVQAIDYLHVVGVCHGDITGRNVLLQLSNFNSWTEQQLYERLGQPWIDPVLKRDETPPGPSAPRYLVEPIAFHDLEPKWLAGHIQIIDFGVAFFTSSRPENMLGTPLNYLAPEAIFELKAGPHSDDWALACVIYLLRAGRELLRIQRIGAVGDAVLEIVDMLGPLPEHWDRITFNEEGLPVHGVQGEYGQTRTWSAPGETLEHPLIDLVRNIEAYSGPTEWHNDDEIFQSQVTADQKELGQYLKPRDMEEKDPMDEAWKRTSEKQIQAEEERRLKAPKISPAEAASLFDLLSRVLIYDSEKRINTAEIGKHDWFIRDFDDF